MAIEPKGLPLGSYFAAHEANVRFVAGDYHDHSIKTLTSPYGITNDNHPFNRALLYSTQSPRN
jgi:hypothetical protein